MRPRAITQKEKELIYSIAEKACADAMHKIAKHPEIKNQSICIPQDYMETYENILAHYTYLIVIDSYKLAHVYAKLPDKYKNLEICTAFLEVLSDILHNGIVDMLKLKHKSNDKCCAKWRKILVSRYCSGAQRIFFNYLETHI